MAPLPPNSTARFRVQYTTIAKQHTMEIRSTSSPSAIGVIVDALLTALGAAIFGLTIDVVEFAASGSNVFNPVTTGIEGNVYGSGSGTTVNVPSYFNFIGRTSGGRRVRLAVFGAAIAGGDYRFIAGELAVIDAARAVLVSAGGAIMGIDGLTPVWKSYVNAGFNAYWQRAVRP